jgi:hypothetical protein
MYLSDDTDTLSYWHLAVLANPRVTLPCIHLASRYIPICEILNPPGHSS